MKRDNTDRNRTSPFAFTGNKFELRAVGSSQSMAMTMAYLDVAVAEALDEMSESLEKRIADGTSVDEAILTVVRKAYKECRVVVFNGNNYGAEWVAEAGKRGLPNATDTPAALEILAHDDTAAFLEEYGVFKRYELKARYVISLEKYCRALKIEAVQMLRMAKTGVLPAAMKHQKTMAESIREVEAQGITIEEQRAELAHFVEASNATFHGMNAVRRALRSAPTEEGSPACARHLADELVPAMRELREGCDAVERRVDASLWPFPTYHQMLFQ